MWVPLRFHEDSWQQKTRVIPEFITGHEETERLTGRMNRVTSHPIFLTPVLYLSFVVPIHTPEILILYFPRECFSFLEHNIRTLQNDKNLPKNINPLYTKNYFLMCVSRRDATFQKVPAFKHRKTLCLCPSNEGVMISQIRRTPWTSVKWEDLQFLLILADTRTTRLQLPEVLKH